MNEKNRRMLPIRDSFAELKDTRTLATCAMLLAVQVLLSLFTGVQIGPTLRISFGFLASATTAYLFGPVPAMANAALSDIICYLLRPTGAYHPGFTLSALLGGLIYGLMFYRRRVTPTRVVWAKLIVDIVCNLALNTLWLYQLQGRAFMALLPARAIKNMLQLPLDVVLLMTLFGALHRAFRALGRPMPDVQRRFTVPARRLIAALAVIIWIVCAIWLNNTSLLVDATGQGPKLLAHRGMAQTFDISTVQWDTNTAEIIYPPEHEFLENTIASMRRAFELGADSVELDLHRTKDDKLAVFHDYLVDYRTDAKGPVHDFTMAELKRLDIGYGYTADGGQTYPFRGKGVGLMPEFAEVLAAFPDRDLLIHIKDDDEETAALAWQEVMGLEPDRLAQLAFYGVEAAMAYLRNESEELRVMSMQSLKESLIQYELLGWSGYIPESLKHTQIHVPIKYARFLWGWPARFMQRMDSVDTRVILVAGDGDWSEGFDDMDMMNEIPDNYTGYVWTNRIDRVGGTK